jgi:hypothetical protein
MHLHRIDLARNMHRFIARSYNVSRWTFGRLSG